MAEFGTDNDKETLSKNELIEKTIRKHADFIFRMAYGSLRNRADAEDVLQDVSIALVTSNAPLNDENYLKSWLAKVTLNKCRDLVRARKYRSAVPLEDCSQLAAEEARGVMEELWQLPERYSRVLYLYYYERFTISEIAGILGKSANTVGSQLRRARKALEKIIKGGSSYD